MKKNNKMTEILKLQKKLLCTKFPGKNMKPFLKMKKNKGKL